MLEQVEQVVFRLASTVIEYTELLHHTGMTIFAWVGLKYAPGGSSTIFQVTKQLSLCFI